MSASASITSTVCFTFTASLIACVKRARTRPRVRERKTERSSVFRIKSSSCEHLVLSSSSPFCWYHLVVFLELGDVLRVGLRRLGVLFDALSQEVLRDDLDDVGCMVLLRWGEQKRGGKGGGSCLRGHPSGGLVELQRRQGFFRGKDRLNGSHGFLNRNLRSQGKWIKWIERRRRSERIRRKGQCDLLYLRPQAVGPSSMHRQRSHKAPDNGTEREG